MNFKQKFTAVLAIGMGLLAFSNAFGNTNTDFQVNFSNCVESIGVGLVPTNNAQQYIPAGFILVGAGQPVTPLVVRTAKCAITFNNQTRIGEIVQIGAVIVPPDGTGDINNYTFFYYTDDLRLASRLFLTGVPAQFVPIIDYQQGADNSFSVRVPLPGIPHFTVSGTVMPSPNPAGSFTANWWRKSLRGRVKMNTNVPVINIGGANLELKSNPNGLLGQIIGGETLGFPAVQQFNSFANAQMNVSTLNP
jgi:hypothetical protein